MFIDKNSLKINNVNMGDYIIDVEYQYPKLWGDDTGRNLAGSFKGTLLGVFPKFILTFRKLTKSEVEYLAPIFDSEEQEVYYYDPNKQDYRTVKTYSGDWSIKYNGVLQTEDNVKISFICEEKR